MILDRLRELRGQLVAQGAPKPGGFYVVVADAGQALELRAHHTLSALGGLPPEVQAAQGDYLDFVGVVLGDVAVMTLRKPRGD